MTLRVPLLEVFSSFQGEGPHVGARQIFVRLARCDLRCSFCDTPESFPTPSQARVQLEPGGERDDHPDNPVAVDTIVEAITRLDDPPGVHQGISVTGGEPLLHPAGVRAIAMGARALGLHVHVETGGHRPGAVRAVLDAIDALSPDMKLESATGFPTPWDVHGETYRIAAEAGKLLGIKAIVAQHTPAEEVEAAAIFCSEHAPGAPFILQPVTQRPGGPATPIASQLFRLHAAAGAVHPDVRVIPQVHVGLGLR